MSSMASLPNPLIIAERSLFWGLISMTWLYGINCFMFVYSAHRLVSLRQATRLYLVVSSLLLALITVYVVMNTAVGELMWIDHRDTPGGPILYFLSILSRWWHIVGDAAGQATNIVADGLLIYRCYVIYNGSWKIVMGLIPIYMASMAMAFAITIRNSVHTGDDRFYDAAFAQIGIAGTVLSVCLNIIITALITYRILNARRTLVQYFPDRSESIETYTSLIAIMVESALPFSVLGLAFAVIFGRQMQQDAALILAWTSLSALSPQLIIFRIASGRAWTKRVASDISALKSDISSAICSTVWPSNSVTQGNVQLIFDRQCKRVYLRQTNDGQQTNVQCAVSEKRVEKKIHVESEESLEYFSAKSFESI